MTSVVGTGFKVFGGEWGCKPTETKTGCKSSEITGLLEQIQGA